MGVRKTIHQKLDGLGRQGIAVNDARTGKVHATLPADVADDVLEAVRARLRAERAPDMEVEETRARPLKPVRMRTEDLLQLVDRQGLTRTKEKMEAAGEKDEAVKEFKKYLMPRYQLREEGDDLVGFLPVLARKQLEGREPMYKQQLEPNNDFGPTRFVSKAAGCPDIPDTVQSYEYDCGPESVQGVLQSKGIRETENDLIQEMETDNDIGTAPEAIVSAFRKRGFDVKPGNYELQDVRDTLDAGNTMVLVIQAWPEDNAGPDWRSGDDANHYVTAIDHDAEGITLEDPWVKGRVRMTDAELLEVWHADFDGKPYDRYGIVVAGEPEDRKPPMMKTARLLKIAKIILDIDLGDTVLVGRFKNKPVKVESIGTDENGQPTINGRKLLALRIAKLLPEGGPKAATTSAAAKKLRKQASRKMLRAASNMVGDSLEMASPLGNKTKSQWLVGEYMKDGIPEAKARQIVAKQLVKSRRLNRLMRAVAPDPDEPFVNVASGSNIQALLTRRPLYGLEYQRGLVDWANSAKRQTGKQGVDQVFDIFTEHAKGNKFKEGANVLASHACGGLTDCALDMAAKARAKRIAMLSCCSFKWQELSKRIIANRMSDQAYADLARRSSDMTTMPGILAQMEIDDLRANFLRGKGYNVLTGWFKDKAGNYIPAGGWMQAIRDDIGDITNKLDFKDEIAKIIKGLRKEGAISDESKARLIGALVGGLGGSAVGYALSDDDDVVGNTVIGAGLGALGGAGSVGLYQKIRDELLSPRKRRRRSPGRYVPESRSPLGMDDETITYGKDERYKPPINPVTETLDVEQAYKQVYGDKWPEELEKARQHAKAIGVPWDPADTIRRHPKYRQVPTPDAFSRTLPKGGTAWLLSKLLQVENEVGIPILSGPIRQRRSAATQERFADLIARDKLRTDMGMSPEDMLDMSSPAGAKGTFMHELAHWQSLAGDPVSSESYMARLARKHGFSPSNATYPESVIAETIPPLSAMQQWYFGLTGSRIESDADYEKAVELMERTRTGALPPEVRRFKRYRLNMQERSEEQLRAYDNYNKELIPAIVLRTDDGMEKVAAESLQAYRRALDLAEGRSFRNGR